MPSSPIELRRIEQRSVEPSRGEEANAVPSATPRRPDRSVVGAQSDHRSGGAGSLLLGVAHGVTYAAIAAAVLLAVLGPCWEATALWLAFAPLNLLSIATWRWVER